MSRICNSIACNLKKHIYNWRIPGGARDACPNPQPPTPRPFFFSISSRKLPKNRFTFLALVLAENPRSATVFVNISITCFREIHLNFIVTKTSVGSKAYSGRREESSLIWSEITDSGLLSQPQTGSLDEPSEPM